MSTTSRWSVSFSRKWWAESTLQVMRKKFVAGNWKMNTTKSSAVELAKGIARGTPDGVEAGVAVPFVYIDAVGQALAGSRVMLGAQDAYFENNGAFTGEISVEMLKDLGVKFCLTGHSERRHVLKEPPELVSRKAHKIYGAGMVLIHCVGEKLEGRDATDAQAQEVHAFIRKSIGSMWNKDFADRVRIQYGGSMKPENAKGLLGQGDVDGGLIGGASLKAESFLGIVNAAK